ncbi:DUF4249 domain-containing protein [Pontibacter anaerobius]|uniref:DUF4249 domain-containing protein n=1 Tax=Pontibacter anaerobius TaxID=2993940 RepID=A0ABT3RJP9_9BACT|nr:DUF4249 domain-containing protein [Pontibacter anaerobius]MCX2742088.1 DUF4249 domain-containing protein [Pontibacter anaerobius]
MKRKNWLWALVLTVLALPACVEPFELETGSERKSLVVDGMITDQNRPDLNKVALSWTAPFNGDDKTVLTQPVYGAEVMVKDARNNNMLLTEGEYGVYTLPESEFKAQIGESYTLYIRLPDGREYESRPELLVPVPPIQDIKYEFREFINVVENAAGALVEKRTVGFDVKVQTRDLEERGNFYRWDTEGVFEYFSDTEDRIDYYTKKPLPGLCWSNKGSINTKIATADDRLVNGRLFEHAIVVVPADIPTKYRVKVRQYSLTAEAYEFWRLFNEQQSSVGSIFDPPPAQIRGNLFSTTNPEEQVIGYFGASSLTERYIVIPRYLYAPFPGLTYTVPKGDCRYLGLYPNVTDQRPKGF